MLIIDTGPLLATANRSDARHKACRALLEDEPGPLVTTAMVIAEATYLIDRQLGPAAEAALFASIVDGSVHVEELDQADWVRIHELVKTYADLRLGGTDASVVAIAERLGATRVATLNRRHFSVVRPRHVERSNYCPEGAHPAAHRPAGALPAATAAGTTSWISARVRSVSSDRLR